MRSMKMESPRKEKRVLKVHYLYPEKILLYGCMHNVDFMHHLCWFSMAGKHIRSYAASLIHEIIARCPQVAQIQQSRKFDYFAGV